MLLDTTNQNYSNILLEEEEVDPENQRKLALTLETESGNTQWKFLTLVLDKEVYKRLMRITLRTRANTRATTSPTAQREKTKTKKPQESS